MVAREFRRVPMVLHLVDVPPAAEIVVQEILPGVGLAVVRVDAALLLDDGVFAADFAPHLACRRRGK